MQIYLIEFIEKHLVQVSGTRSVTTFHDLRPSYIHLGHCFLAKVRLMKYLKYVQ